MVAEILSVGTELLLGDIVDTNASFISRELAKLGINVYRKTVVGDNRARLLSAFGSAFGGADLVVATGGLGPTDDDITKEVAAEYFGLPLVLHDESWEAIKRIFGATSNSAWLPANNKKQSMLPEGCVVLPNANGTAPGVCIEQNGKILILLPGPPNEMEPMFTGRAVPILRAKTDTVFVSRNLKIVGVGESRAEELLRDMFDAQTNPTLALYAKVSEVWLRITASAKDEAKACGLIGPVAESVYERLGENVYGEDADTLEGVGVEILKKRGLTLSCAESCTGGMLASAIVNVPGASEIFIEGIVAYSNESKRNRLGVKMETLCDFGAVSARTASEMAEGAAKTSGASVGISTTGVAGPSGGSDEKPVGLVYIGLYVEGRGAITREYKFSGDRMKIRRRAVVSALDLLRRELLRG